MSYYISSVRSTEIFEVQIRKNVSFYFFHLAMRDQRTLQKSNLSESTCSFFFINLIFITCYRNTFFIVQDLGTIL